MSQESSRAPRPALHPRQGIPGVILVSETFTEIYVGLVVVMSPGPLQSHMQAHESARDYFGSTKPPCGASDAVSDFFFFSGAPR